MNDIKEKLIQFKLADKTAGIVVKKNSDEQIDVFLDRIALFLKNDTELIELVPAGMSDSQLLEISKKIKQLCEMFGATFIVRNRVDIAYLSSADGVNLEQDSIDILSAREIVGKEFIIGRYLTCREDLFKSVKDGADYITISNIPSTPTEPVTSTGLEYAKWVSENTSLAVFVCGEFNSAQQNQFKNIGITKFLNEGTILNPISPNTVTVE